MARWHTLGTRDSRARPWRWRGAALASGGWRMALALAWHGMALDSLARGDGVAWHGDGAALRCAALARGYRDEQEIQ